MSAAPSENVLGSPRFEPLRVLGEGGSGIVYEVRIRAGDGERDRRETLALKVLRAELAPSERERKRFLAEAERMQRLDAPGLVALLESGLLPDGRPYLAMPLLDGETLAERLKRGPLSAAVATRYFAILAAAIDALHAAGMVHRDVKPENIMLVDDAPVLLDFGIARDIDDGTTTTTAEGRVRGTPAYMAPERFFGAPASVRSDVYELGVVLYMMLVGRLPWGSEKSVTDRLNPANPRDAGADVSRTLATVILRALSTRPEVRPATARELAAEVAAAAGEAAAPSRRTLDVDIQQPPPGLTPLEVSATTEEGAFLPAKTQGPTRLRAPRRRWSLFLTVSLTCVVAAVVGLGARAIGRTTAQGSAPSPPVSAITAPPIVPFTGAITTAAPIEATSAATTATMPSASAATSSTATLPRASATPPRLPPAAAAVRTSARPGPSGVASGATTGPGAPASASAGIVDPARYYEDRR